MLTSATLLSLSLSPSWTHQLSRLCLSPSSLYTGPDLQNGETDLTAKHHVTVRVNGVASSRPAMANASSPQQRSSPRRDGPGGVLTAMIVAADI